MKIKFKKQAYQTDAVIAVVDCFKGQMKSAGIQYRVDPGKREFKKGQQTTMDDYDESAGFKNSDLRVLRVKRVKSLLFTNLYKMKTSKNI